MGQGGVILTCFWHSSAVASVDL